jgi:hypothetical protein
MPRIRWDWMIAIVTPVIRRVVQVPEGRRVVTRSLSVVVGTGVLADHIARHRLASLAFSEI